MKLCIDCAHYHPNADKATWLPSFMPCHAPQAEAEKSPVDGQVSYTPAKYLREDPAWMRKPACGPEGLWWEPKPTASLPTELQPTRLSLWQWLRRWWSR